MNIDAMKAELKQLDAQADELETKRRDLRQQIANVQAVFVVGDRVTYDGAKYVWQITAIRPGYGNKPKYIGVRIKKNGTPSVQSGEIFTSCNSELRAA